MMEKIWRRYENKKGEHHLPEIEEDTHFVILMIDDEIHPLELDHDVMTIATLYAVVVDALWLTQMVENSR